MMHNNNGLTLINLIISIGIITLLLTITVPSINRFKSNINLSGSARNLVFDIRLAQQLTVSEQMQNFIQFNDSQTYTILRNPLSPSIIKKVNFSKGVFLKSISPNLENCIMFNSFGAAIQSGSIVMSNENNKEIIIEIKPSGYIELKQ